MKKRRTKASRGKIREKKRKEPRTVESRREISQSALPLAHMGKKRKVFGTPLPKRRGRGGIPPSLFLQMKNDAAFSSWKEEKNT